MHVMDGMSCWKRKPTEPKLDTLTILERAIRVVGCVISMTMIIPNAAIQRFDASGW
jgi:hypothetical protein